MMQELDKLLATFEANANAIETIFMTMVDLSGVPSTSEPQRCREFRMSPTQVAGLEPQLQRLERLGAAIEAAKAKAVRISNRLHGYSAPICGLPIDVLRMIFEAVVDGVPGPQHEAELRRITQVSPFWRSVAIRTSSLWRYIDAAWPLDQIDTWHARRAGRLYHLSCTRGRANDWEIEYEKKLLDHLRIAEVHKLFVSIGALQRIGASLLYQSDIIGGMQNLKILRVTGTNQTVNFLAPHVEHLKIELLNGVSYSQFTRLRTLCLESVRLSADELASALRSNPSLERLQLQYINAAHVGGGKSDDVEPILLPNLRQIVFQVTKVPHTPDLIIGALVTPCLQTAFVRIPVQDRDPVGIAASAVLYAHWLQSCAHLERLAFSIGRGGKFFRLLLDSIMESSYSLLALNRLSIAASHDKYPFDNIRAFLEYRRRAAQTLPPLFLVLSSLSGYGSLDHSRVRSIREDKLATDIRVLTREETPNLDFNGFGL